MRNRVVVTCAVVVGLAAAGCSSFTAGGARPAAVRDLMRDYRFPVACEALWVDGLKVLASKGFELVGTDRELAGQDKQGAFSNLLNAGHSTTRDDRGVFESETDFDSTRLRYQIRGTPAGPDGCFVVITSIKQERGTMEESRFRDYDLELLVLSRAAPAEAARINDAAEKAAK
jgi:hypothetical protein